MVRTKRVRTTKRLLYFFLDGKIHKSLRISRARDEIVAWCYPDKRRVMYSYSLVKKSMQKAYSLKEAALLLNKHKVTVEDYILEGKIQAPTKIYPISNPDDPGWSKYMLREEDILKIHQFILDDGYSSSTPSRSELLALLRHDTILYTKTNDGRFVPVWKAEE
jgi:hypothetical protein